MFLRTFRQFGQCGELQFSYCCPTQIIFAFYPHCYTDILISRLYRHAGFQLYTYYLNFYIEILNVKHSKYKLFILNGQKPHLYTVLIVFIIKEFRYKKNWYKKLFYLPQNNILNFMNPPKQKFHHERSTLDAFPHFPHFPHTRKARIIINNNKLPTLRLLERIYFYLHNGMD